MEILSSRPDDSPKIFTYLPLGESIESTFLTRGSAADIWKVKGDVAKNGHSNCVYISKVVRVAPEDFMNYTRSKTTGTDKSSNNKISWEYFLQKCKEKVLVWVQLTHNNVVKVYGIQQSLNICVEYCAKGSLREYLQEKNEGHPCKEMIVEFPTPIELPSRLSTVLRFTTSLKGWNTYTAGIHQWSMAILIRLVITCSSAKIPQMLFFQGKIFIDAGGHTKIGEFGLTALCYHAAPLLSTVVFTGFNRWMSPELFNFESDSIPTPTLASDIWALACTIFEIISEKLPYPNYKHDIRVQRAILKGERPGHFSEEAEGSYGPGFWTIVESCWSENPLQRPSIMSIITSYPQSQSPQSPPNQPTRSSEIKPGKTGGERGKMISEGVTEMMEQVYVRSEGMNQMQERADAVMEEFEKSLAAEREAEKVHREAIAAREREQQKVQALIDEELIDDERKKDVQRKMEKVQGRERDVRKDENTQIGTQRPTSESIITSRFGVELASTGEPESLLHLRRPTSKLELPSKDANFASRPGASKQGHDSHIVTFDSKDSKAPLVSPVDDDPVLSSSGDPIISPTTLRGHFKEMAVGPSGFTRPLISSLLESSTQTGDLIVPQVDAAYSRVGPRSVSHYGRLTGMRTSPYPLSPSQRHFHSLYPPSTSSILHREDSSCTAGQNLASSTSGVMAIPLPHPQPSISGGGLPPPPRQKPQNQSVRSPPRVPWAATSPLMIGLRKTSWEQYYESRLGFEADDEGTEDEGEDGERKDQSNWAWAAGQRIHKHMPSFLDLRTRRQSQL
ncbi:kinase-like domain-containing protein [Rhizoctonia solani]|nr:kinase-like domain-containing protein [Rhizoctonia solani]